MPEALPLTSASARARPRQNTLTSGLPGVSVVERNLAADGRDADAVAVAGNPGDDPFDRAAGPGAFGSVHLAEAQRVHEGDRTRAHREDVADDAADPRRRSLVRLDERRVVVRLDLEDGRQPVADVDGARILAGTLQHARTFGRQLPQVHARALVAAVLRPHDGEDAELGQRRLAPQRADDAVVLVGLETVAFEDAGFDWAHGSGQQKQGEERIGGRRRGQHHGDQRHGRTGRAAARPRCPAP